MTTLDKLRDALLTVGVPVSHYTSLKNENRYIVWAEDSQPDAVWCDNQMKEQSIAGTVHFFTKVENDPDVWTTQTAIASLGISYYLNSIQYEEDTGFTHYEWVWQMWV